MLHLLASQLFRLYSNPDPPPVELIRIPQLMELFLQTLFKPGAIVNAEHRHKYTYLLAYAASVHETFKKVTDKLCAVAVLSLCPGK